MRKSRRRRKGNGEDSSAVRPPLTATAPNRASCSLRLRRDAACRLLNSRQPSFTEVPMRRIGLAVVLAVSLSLASLAVEGQSAAKIFRIGLLGSSSPTAPEASRIWEAFFQGLRELGYVEGQNLLIEGRVYEHRTERLPALAAELVRLKVDVIVAQGPPAPEAAQRATSTIPIVMTVHQDPVGSGLVASLARPGRNVTGLSVLSTELVGKRLQLLKEAVPGLSRVAVLSDPTHPAATLQLREAEVAARSLKVQLQVLEARAPGDFAGAFSAMTKDRAGGRTADRKCVFF